MTARIQRGPVADPLADWIDDAGRFDRPAPSRILDLTPYPVIVEDDEPRGLLPSVARYAHDRRGRIEVAILMLAAVAVALFVGRFALALLHGWHP